MRYSQTLDFLQKSKNMNVILFAQRARRAYETQCSEESPEMFRSAQHDNSSIFARGLLVGLVLAIVLFLFPLSAEAASSSSISRSAGNALSGKDFSGQSLMGEEYSNLNLENTNFSNANLRGGVFNGSVLQGVNLHGVDFSEGIAYLVVFKDADLSDAIFTNAMMLRSTFDNVNITGADFSYAILDRLQVKKLCAQASGVNSQTGVSTAESLGCM